MIKTPTFTVLRAAVDALQPEAPVAPVRVDAVNVGHDARVEVSENDRFSFPANKNLLPPHFSLSS